MPRKFLLSLLPILSNIFHSYKTKHIKYISSSKNINMSDEMAHSLRHDCVQSLGPQRPTFSQRTGESTRPYATSPFHGDMESIKEFTTSSACANGMSCSRWRPLHTTSGPTHPPRTRPPNSCKPGWEGGSKFSMLLRLQSHNLAQSVMASTNKHRNGCKVHGQINMFAGNYKRTCFETF